MLKVISDSEKIRYSAYHMIRAFLPDEEIVQENDLPGLTVTDESGRIIASLPAPLPGRPEADLYIYDTFASLTGRQLPWGVLTGVRPVKLAMESLDKESEEEFVRRFMAEKRVSRDKALLSRNIAQTERSIIRGALGGRDMDHLTYSMYVGIPVCPSICSYCSFSSGPLSVWKDRMDEYVDALTGELKLCADRLKEYKLTSIYIGGGTPTVLEEAQLERLLDCLDIYYGAEGTLEYTLEAGRPDTITEAKLDIAKAHGITRLSINPQSMKQKTLDLIGRAHTVRQVEEAFYMARDMGFENINMDIIAGLPEENEQDMADTIKKIAAFGPDSLTVHALAIKRAAAFSRQCADAETADRMIQTAADGAASMGMRPYYMYRQKSIAGNLENTGYALPGKESIYNIMIMEDVQSIAAFGAGATTKILLDHRVQNPDRAEGVLTNLLRQDNVSSIAEYISRFEEMAQAKIKIMQG